MLALKKYDLCIKIILWIELDNLLYCMAEELILDLKLTQTNLSFVNILFHRSLCLNKCLKFNYFCILYNMYLAQIKRTKLEILPYK